MLADAEAEDEDDVTSFAALRAEELQAAEEDKELEQMLAFLLSTILTRRYSPSPQILSPRGMPYKPNLTHTTMETPRD
jgi:hypothetical protein